VDLKRTDLAVAAERAILVGVSQQGAAMAAESLAELRRLAETANANVVAELIQHRRTIDGATYLGRGKVDELADLCRQTNADVIIMDVDLAAAQVQNLEEMTDRKVIDRTELILDIFARGAQTAMACDQVELAQLEYTFPRLKHMWTHLERVEGGIGMRGPGERQIETDRRLIRKRIQDLKGRIAENVKRRTREVRARSDEATACLVGYTNAGKSTLMNALTGAGVLADDKLFATLDTRTRACDLGEGRKMLLSDTVGFIRNLPHHLVASFQATLEEARHADLLLHVVDTGNPYAREQMQAVIEVLGELGIAEHAIMNVYNKMDLPDAPAHLPLLHKEFGDGVAVSAATGRGMGDLRVQVQKALDSGSVTVIVEAPHAAGKLRAFLSERGEILSSKYTDDMGRFIVRLAPRHLGVVRKLGGKVRRAPARVADHL
jgi:GTP-binding protein HflX